MLRPRFLVFGAAVVLLAACGGNVVTGGGDGGSAGTAGAGGTAGQAGSGGASDGGIAGQAGSGGASDGGMADSGVDCKAVRAHLDELRELAQVCDPSINMLQCNAVVQGLCCPTVVTQTKASATDAFLTALEQARQLGCNDICAVVDCASPTTGWCEPDPTGATPGRCVEVY